MKHETIVLQSMRDRLADIKAMRSLLDEEEGGLNQAIGALEKQLGKSSTYSAKKALPNLGRREKRERIVSEITDFLKKNGDCKSKQVQAHLEAVGLYEKGAAGNQAKLSRLLADETETKNSLIKKDKGGFVSLRK